MVSINYEGSILGTSTNEFFGIDCRLSHDGKVIATINGSDSTTKVYKDINGTWTQQGSDIDILVDNSLSSSDYTDVSIDVSHYNDVIRVAIAQWAASTNKGVAALYEYNGTSWDQLGSSFIGEANNVRLGYTLSLNKYGNVLSLGNYNTSGTTSYSKVLTYFWSDSNSKWYDYGNVDIINIDQNSDSISTVSISHDGKRMIVGNPLFTSSGVEEGRIRAFKHNDSDNTWTQIGSNSSLANNLNYGTTVAMSGDGNYAYAHGISSTTTTTGVTAIFNITDSALTFKDSVSTSNLFNHFEYNSACSYSGDYFVLGVRWQQSTVPGYLMYYNYNKTTEQISRLTYISGPSNDDGYGSGVGINDTGDMVIVGSYRIGTSPNQRGGVVIYSVDGITLDIEASGDPYLRNMYGEVMKLPDANQDYTMIETKNGELKVEITTTLLNDIQKAQYWNKCKQYFPQLQNQELYNQNLLNTFSANICFIRYVDITYMGEHKRYDLFNKLTNVKEINDEYNGMGVEKTLSFMVDNKEVLVKLQQYDNPQIVSGVSYKIPSRLQLNGLVTETDMMKYNMITEEYVTASGNREVTMKHLQL